MPLYHFQCNKCNKHIRKILTFKDIDDFLKIPCHDCAGKIERASENATPSVVAMEVLDNGLMAKRVVRISEAERIYKERSANDPRNKKEDVI